MTLLFIGMGLAACNTVEGAGQDIQKGGEAIEDSAK
ncbi:MAG: entericidin A/B family lipoprotein [Parvibaculum sp.]|nr:entericidin A/B family lipoprotein [Parvibaculum sp.]